MQMEDRTSFAEFRRVINESDAMFASMSRDQTHLVQRANHLIDVLPHDRDQAERLLQYSRELYAREQQIRDRVQVAAQQEVSFIHNCGLAEPSSLAENAQQTIIVNGEFEKLRAKYTQTCNSIDILRDFLDAEGVTV